MRRTGPAAADAWSFQERNSSVEALNARWRRRANVKGYTSFAGYADCMPYEELLSAQSAAWKYALL